MKIQNLICMFCAGLLITGCSYFDTSEEGREEAVVTVPAETIDLTIRQPDIDNSSSDSSDSVEVYSIPSEYMASISGGEIDQVGQDYKPADHFGDPNVEVYPLDEDMRGLVSAGFVKPQKRLYPSPFSPESSVDTRVLNPSRAMPAKKNASSLSNRLSTDRFVNMEQSRSLPLDPPNLLEQADPEYVTVTSPAGDVLRIYFGHNTIYPGPQYNPMISDVANAFIPAPGRVLSIEGHASRRANVENATQRKIVNLKISMERAFNVARLLMENGVAEDSIRVVGWGESKFAPSVPGMDPESTSRRVEILQMQ